MPTTGEVIVESFVAHGIDRIFCVPGESYLGLLDALHGRANPKVVVTRHEAGAGFMAIADARLTGRPAVACVSRGPGSCNAAIAVHAAEQDSVPFVLLIGQVPVRDLRRDAFQEIDYGRMFGSIAKYVTEVSDPDRIGEELTRAIQASTTGRPGPVVIVLPEDILSRPSSAPVSRPQAPVRAAPLGEDVARLRELLGAAKRPLVVAGAEFNQPGGREALLRFLEGWDLPCAVAFRNQDLLPNDHRLYVGALGYSAASQLALLRQSDCVLVLGDHLSHVTSNGHAFPPAENGVLIHACRDPACIGVRVPADLAIAADGPAVLALLDQGDPPACPPRTEWIGRLRTEQARQAVPRIPEVEDGVPFEAVIDLVGRNLAPDAIVTVDAGNFGLPVYRLIPFRPPQRLLGPISGAMGYGVPAAVAAALRHPGRPVTCFVGDGGFLMTGNELSAALERGLPLKVIVADNGIYGTIRVNQEREFPGRVVATSFANPDLELIGRAFGFTVTRIGTPAELAKLPPVLAAEGPQMIIVRSSIQAILPAPAARTASA